MRLITLALIVSLFASCTEKSPEQGPENRHNLIFDHLALTWDEAIPLGNGEMGLLIWNRDGKLRFSLDRADLWDLRPVPQLHTDEFSFAWVYERWAMDEYDQVQRLFDHEAYSQSIAPSKIPGAALEFSFNGVADILSAELDLRSATAYVAWENGTRLESFITADRSRGWFRFTELSEAPEIMLVPPAYQKVDSGEVVNELEGQELTRLGYAPGTLEESAGMIKWHQPGWGDFHYDVAVRYRRVGDELTGTWSVTSSIAEARGIPVAHALVQDGYYRKDRKSHLEWWRGFWSKSSIRIPDPLLEKQWFLEQYKFGSAARPNTPPIALQAVWTADHGRMPPWKGDFHHDLNTQLSYWPAYSANHLDLEVGFLNWLWEIKPVAEQYTMKFFGVEGLNVPGVTTLTGEPMGGWVQYSCGPTVSAWLGHHFYLHWRYSLDRQFLEERAYPWISETARFIENFSVTGPDGTRKFPLGSSPEVFDNSRRAWFSETTNFDLSLVRFTFGKAAELAAELGLQDEADHWRRMLELWPAYSIDSTGFNFAPGVPYHDSHRHFSHLMAWHPLGEIDWSNGEADREVIIRTLESLEHFGPAWWVGYSYSWLGNLYARAFMGDKAAAALRDFATAFCLPNSFHVNGDQTRSGKSNFTYRPFTLEGNFAFASGIQEMLLQSHTGVIRLFPALPDDWTECRFDGFRAEGGVIISGTMENGVITRIVLKSEPGGRIRILIPDDAATVLELELGKGESWEWSRGS